MRSRLGLVAGGLALAGSGLWPFDAARTPLGQAWSFADAWLREGSAEDALLLPPLALAIAAPYLWGLLAVLWGLLPPSLLRRRPAAVALGLAGALLLAAVARAAWIYAISAESPAQGRALAIGQDVASAAALLLAVLAVSARAERAAALAGAVGTSLVLLACAGALAYTLGWEAREGRPGGFALGACGAAAVLWGWVGLARAARRRPGVPRVEAPDPPRICALVPVYNNARTIGRVVAGVLEVHPDLIVIDDGSTDATPRILDGFGGLERLRLPENRGKGAALLEGLERARVLGFDAAVAIDGDGQHDPRDIARLAEAARERPGSIVIGTRGMREAGAPWRSRLGLALSNAAIWLQTGLRLADTQSGFRVYPVGRTLDLRVRARRFAFEVEVLVRSAWAGIPIHEVPVGVVYPEDRITHFRPLRDVLRITGLHLRLLAERLGIGRGR